MQIMCESAWILYFYYNLHEEGVHAQTIILPMIFSSLNEPALSAELQIISEVCCHCSLNSVNHCIAIAFKR